MKKYVCILCILLCTFLIGCTKSNKKVEKQQENSQKKSITNCSSLHYWNESIYFISNGEVKCYRKEELKTISSGIKIQNLISNKNNLFAYSNDFQIFTLENGKLEKFLNLSEDVKINKLIKNGIELVAITKDEIYFRTEEQWNEKKDDLEYSDFYSYNISTKKLNLFLENGDYNYHYCMDDANLYLSSDKEIVKINCCSKKMQVLYQVEKNAELYNMYLNKKDIIVCINKEKQGKGYYKLSDKGTLCKISDTTSAGGGSYCYDVYLYFCSTIEDEQCLVTQLDLQTGEQKELAKVTCFSELVVSDDKIYYLVKDFDDEKNGVYFCDLADTSKVKKIE